MARRNRLVLLACTIAGCALLGSTPAGATTRITVSPTAPEVKPGKSVEVRYLATKGVTGIDVSVDGDGISVERRGDKPCAKHKETANRTAHLDIGTDGLPQARSVCVFASADAKNGSITAVGSEASTITTPVKVTGSAADKADDPCATAEALRKAGEGDEAKKLILKMDDPSNCKATLEKINHQSGLRRFLDIWKWIPDTFGEFVRAVVAVIAFIIAVVLLRRAWKYGRRPSLEFGDFDSPDGEAKPGPVFKNAVAALFGSPDAGADDVPVPGIAQVDVHLDLVDLSGIEDLSPQLKQVGAALKLFNAIVPSDSWSISGQLLTSTENGSGVALLATKNHNVIAADTLWYGEPDATTRTCDVDANLAIVAAAWARCAVARKMNGLASNPASFAWLCIGLVEHRRSNWHEAKRLLGMALDADPSNVRARVAWGLEVAKLLGMEKPPQTEIAIEVLENILADVEQVVS